MTHSATLRPNSLPTGQQKMKNYLCVIQKFEDVSQGQLLTLVAFTVALPNQMPFFCCRHRIRFNTSNDRQNAA